MFASIMKNKYFRKLDCGLIIVIDYSSLNYILLKCYVSEEVLIL